MHELFDSATDWHCHLLPGIDDGPATLEEAVAMGLALSRAGFETVCCTPHLIRGSFEADNAAVRNILALLQSELSRLRIPLRLLPGREYYLDEFLSDYLHDPLPLGESRFLLIEIPGHAPVAFVKETCYRIRSRGYIPMIAHPERCELFKLPPRKPEGVLQRLFTRQRSRDKSRGDGIPPDSLLAYLRDIGCVFQGNLGSFAGRYGKTVRDSALALRERDVYGCFGTDLHSVAGLAAILDRERAGSP